MSKRSISTMPLLFASVSAILGSGWLFSAYYTSILAGPDSILAWIIGGVILIVVAFVFAELSAMIPITGSSTRIPQYTHGTLVCFLFSWLIWLAYVSMMPTEVQAVIQYVSYYFPQLIHQNNGLTHAGYGVAVCLMLLVSAINVYSLRWLIQANNFLTVIKIIIPAFFCIVLLSHHHAHSSHFMHSDATTHGVKGVFAAIASGGIIFAFNGFKQACEMAGETKNPSRSLPIAIIGSILICLVIYLLLQFTFLTSLTEASIKDGWAHLHLLHTSSPFATIIYQQHANWLIPLLYVGAIAAPLAAALMYMCSASRSLFGKSKNGHLPEFLQYINPHGNPTRAILVCFVFGLLLFSPLPGWQQMVAFLTSIMSITYAIAPVCLLTLRKQAPNQKRPFKLPFAAVWCYFAFYLCNLMTYWSGWNVISKLGLCLLLGLAILLSYRFTQRKKSQFQYHWRASIWVWFYFIGMSVISYCGQFGNGLGLLTTTSSLIVIAAFSGVIMLIATTWCIPAEQTQKYISELNISATRSDA